MDKNNRTSIFFASITRILLCFIFLVFIFMVISSLVNTTKVYGLTEVIFLICFFIVGMALISIFVNKYFTVKEYITLLIALSFSIRFIWIGIIPTEPVSDFKIMYDGAVQASKGLFDFSNSTYFTTWPYQLGFTMYQALVVKLFGEGLFILKFVNVIFSVGTCILIYLISTKIFGEAAGRIAGILYAINIPSIFMSSVLTNQYISTFLFTLGFYLITCKYKGGSISFAFLAGIILSIGNIMRPIGGVVLIAMVLYVIICEFIEKTKREKVNGIKFVSIALASYYLLFFVLSQSLIIGGVTEYTLKNRDPLWKFVTGLNYETSGKYSVDDANLVQTLSIGERESLEIEIINDRIKDKTELAQLFVKKYSIMWGERDSSTHWSLGGLDKADTVNHLQKYERVMFISVILIGMISVVYSVFNFPKYRGYILFLLFLLGYVLIHFIIEIQPRYRFESTPSIIIICSLGFSLLGKWIQELMIALKGKIERTT